MRRIPPFNGSVSISYSILEKLGLRMEYIFASEQDRLSSGDLDDHRIDKNGTPSWSTLNLFSNYSLGQFNFGFGINNIFDEAYRTHGSGIDGIGRSYQMTGKIYKTLNICSKNPIIHKILIDLLRNKTFLSFPT